MVAGIWDSMSSQQVVNFIRYQVSKGKELTKIGEMICDYCLAPDTDLGDGFGCDNMSILIVAITHGRSKKDWYAWIKNRVKNNYGYNTPSAYSPLYSEARMEAFHAKKKEHEKSSSAQSAVLQPCSQNDTSTSEIESDDEPPEHKAMKWGPNLHISEFIRMRYQGFLANFRVSGYQDTKDDT